MLIMNQNQKIGKTTKSTLARDYSHIAIPILITQLFLFLPVEISWFYSLQGTSISSIVKLFALIVSIFDILFLLDSFYNLSIGVFGLIPNKLKRDKNNNVIVPKVKKQNKFVLIVCAHNEETVITNSLEEMVKCIYPRDKLKIVVICDNCVDNTFQRASEVAKLHQDQIFILERFSSDKKGKPFAVKYAFDWVEKNIPDYEAVSIADADNIYHPDFFGVMNWKLNNGSKIVQGYLGVKNQYDSPVSTASTLSYFSSALIYWVSRQNLGMSGTIGGTGFVLSRDILEIIGWDMVSLTEDLEFSAKAVLMGHKIDYAYDAITYDEKPTTLKASFHQRKRWMQGHQDVMWRYSGRLLIALLNPFKWTKLSQFDYLLYLLRPTKKLIYGYFFLAVLIIFATNNLGFYQITTLSKNFWLTGTLIILTILLEYFSAVKEGFRWWKLPQIIYYYTLFNWNDYLATFAGVFLASPKGIWVKTDHKITVSMEKVMEN
jgi:cellulose synthase/poly-beta-1,6-N-acetylglucosamine synthase-like glycosyltransferase